MIWKGEEWGSEQLASVCAVVFQASSTWIRAGVIGDVRVRTVCDLMCLGVQRTVATSSSDVSQFSSEWLSAEELLLPAVVLRTLWLGGSDASRSQPWHSEVLSAVVADPGLAGKMKIANNRIR